MPGRHATLVGNAFADDVSGPKVVAEPGLIVRHFAEVCLKRWGTVLVKNLNLTDADLRNHTAAIVNAAAKYKAMEKCSYTWFTELGQGERYVSLGSKGVPFSTVKGTIYTPATGLTTSVLDVEGYRAIR